MKKILSVSLWCLILRGMEAIQVPRIPRKKLSRLLVAMEVGEKIKVPKGLASRQNITASAVYHGIRVKTRAIDGYHYIWRVG